VSTSCKLRNPIAWAGISRKHDHSVRRIKAIGIGLVCATGAVAVKLKMGILDGCHLEVGVLIDNPGTDIMSEEDLIYRYGAASVSNPNLGANGEIMDCSSDKL